MKKLNEFEETLVALVKDGNSEELNILKNENPELFSQNWPFIMQLCGRSRNMKLAFALAGPERTAQGDDHKLYFSDEMDLWSYLKGLIDSRYVLQICEAITQQKYARPPVSMENAYVLALNIAIDEIKEDPNDMLTIIHVIMHNFLYSENPQPTFLVQKAYSLLPNVNIEMRKKVKSMIDKSLCEIDNAIRPEIINLLANYTAWASSVHKKRANALIRIAENTKTPLDSILKLIDQQSKKMANQAAPIFTLQELELADTPQIIEALEILNSQPKTTGQTLYGKAKSKAGSPDFITALKLCKAVSPISGKTHTHK